MAFSRERRRHAVVASGIGLSVAYVLYLLVQPGSARSVTVASDLIQLLVPIAITFPLGVGAAQRSVGRERTAWYLLAAGALTWGLGQAIWSWFEVVRDTGAPFPSAADAGFLATVPLLLVGVAVYPAKLLALGRARAIVDAALIATAGLFAAYGTFLADIYERGEGSWWARTIALAYPVGDLVIAATAVALIARRVEGWRGPVGWVIAGMVALAVADASFAYFVARGDYTDGATDACWAIGFLLIGYAATVRPVGIDDGKALPRAPTVIEAALPMLPVGVAAVVLALRGAGGDGIGPLLGVTGAMTCLLVVARTLIIQVENARLTSDLAQTVLTVQAREEELHHQAFHDAHTGLANRALFRNRLEHSLARRTGADVVVLFIDLDDFKTVNDSLGHDVGDQLLVLVADRLRACVRPADTVARLGGDEFGILVDDADAGARAELLANRVLSALEVPFDVAGRTLRVQASIGLAIGWAGLNTAAGLLQDADLAMYGAKGAGKATYMRFHAALRDEARDRMELLHDIEHALNRQQLEVHYQPVIALPDRELAGYEALVRWRHPSRGLLTPDAFLDLAEESGAIVPIGWWVLEQACAAVLAAPANGAPPPWVAVNLSARQLRDPDVAGTVGAILATTGLEPSRLVLELAESALAESDETLAVTNRLQALGARLTVDHFGSGYAALASLASLPLDAVKVEPSFVASLRPDGSGDGDVLLRAVAQLVDGLGLRMIAVGVEHPYQLRRLVDVGCSAAQGFLVGPPAPQLTPPRVRARSRS